MNFDQQRLPTSKFLKGIPRSLAASKPDYSKPESSNKYKFTQTELIFGASKQKAPKRIPTYSNAKISINNPYKTEKLQYARKPGRGGLNACVDGLANCNIDIVDFFLNLMTSPAPPQYVRPGPAQDC